MLSGFILLEVFDLTVKKTAICAPDSTVQNDGAQKKTGAQPAEAAINYIAPCARIYWSEGLKHPKKSIKKVKNERCG